MIILGIETSCDETGAAVLEQKNGRIHILSNIVASSASIQAKYGGVIPEQAAREQIKAIIPVIEEALTQAFPDYTLYPIPYTLPIDAIAVTYGPGLIGSLLVGVETAKTLSLVWKKPLTPVNHLIGHFYANWVASSVIPRSDVISDRGNLDSMSKLFPSEIIKIASPHSSSVAPPSATRNDKDNVPAFPCLGLLISGGHTDLVLFTNHGKYKYLGGTRDDAAGECFDKCARLLGLPYPGGPQISKLAQKGNPKAFDLPRPMMEKGDFSAKGGPAYGWDFSFSGLKTAVANLIKTHPVILEGAKRPIESRSYRSDKSDLQDDNLSDLAASIEQAIVDVLVVKVIKAAKVYGISQVMIAGGVASNKKLVSDLKKSITYHLPPITLHIPPPHLCTDNAAMIASAAFFQEPIKNPLNLQADPNLSLSS